MSVIDRGHRPLGIVGRHVGKIVGAFAVALTAAAITAPGASANSPCVDGAWGLASGIENTYEPCVLDEQVLLNDLRRVLVGAQYGMYLIATDGYYGPLTAGDVAAFNRSVGIADGGNTEGDTWKLLCWATVLHGFHGVYWQAAGCPTVA